MTVYRTCQDHVVISRQCRHPTITNELLVLRQPATTQEPAATSQQSIRHRRGSPTLPLPLFRLTVSNTSFPLHRRFDCKDPRRRTQECQTFQCTRRYQTSVHTQSHYSVGHLIQGHGSLLAAVVRSAARIDFEADKVCINGIPPPRYITSHSGV